MRNMACYEPFGDLARFDTSKYGWRRFLSIVAAIAALVVIVFALTACNSSSSDGSLTSTSLPGAPTNFTVINTPETTLSETLTWSPPTTGEAPTSYEVYRSLTPGAFLPENHLISVPVIAGHTVYTFVDNAGLVSTPTYWAVSAKNAGGETAAAEKSDTPKGSSTGGGGGDTGFGNNFSAALIFADDVGITGLPIAASSVWSTIPASAVASATSTGLRPLATEVIPTTTTALPYLDPTTAYDLNGTIYYKQATASTWQGQWEKGAASGVQDVTAKWGDNLISQSLKSTSVIRVEMVLSKAIDPLVTPMTTYPMVSLYGTQTTEVTGTTGVPVTTATSAFVFAANAHLTIWKDGEAPLVDQTLWEGDGPGFLAGEVNVSGNFTYGFVWNLKNVTVTYPKTGLWHIKFSLDPTSPAGTPNNTNITAAPNSISFTGSEATIDINVQ